MSSGPRGPKSDKIWADAIRKAVHEYASIETEEGRKEKVRYINLLATNLVRIAAKQGDPQSIAALREIGDRLDGKSHQTGEQTVRVEHVSDHKPDLAALLAEVRSREAARDSDDTVH